MHKKGEGPKVEGRRGDNRGLFVKGLLLGNKKVVGGDY